MAYITLSGVAGLNGSLPQSFEPRIDRNYSLKLSFFIEHLMMSESPEYKQHFIRQIMSDDVAAGKNDGKVITRFPPEPNGYLHIGHAKSICVNFGLAQDFKGTCHLRFDDTNPCKEEQKFADAICEDVQWLGFDWGEHHYHASDYYQQLYEYAVELINQGKAYVDDLTLEEMHHLRGTLQSPGTNSPNRDRSIQENLALFQQMKNGDFEEGAMVLRAKIDMSSPNLNMRDPVIYRIRHVIHQRTGNAWCIYPMYDFAHSLSDAIEKITHSLCTLEFQDHRPLYDWFVENCHPPGKPQQIEFSRLNLSHTITSKRKLKQLVEEGHVNSWDDPRLPTLRGMRRRGFPAQAIIKLCDMLGVSKTDSVINMSILEEYVRNELNETALRGMAVLNPLKVIITDYPENKVEIRHLPNHPQDPDLGEREVPFSREIYIDRDDFMLDAPKKFFRLAPGKEVRLRGAYVIKCETVITDPVTGEITELHCSHDPATLGKAPEGRKVKGVIHWLSVQHAQTAEVRLYDRLFNVENPGADDDITQHLNANSLQVIEKVFIEPNLTTAAPGQTFQFERVGYFCRDRHEEALVFNRVVALRDTWK